MSDKERLLVICAQQKCVWLGKRGASMVNPAPAAGEIGREIPTVTSSICTTPGRDGVGAKPTWQA